MSLGEVRKTSHSCHIQAETWRIGRSFLAGGLIHSETVSAKVGGMTHQNVFSGRQLFLGVDIVSESKVRS